MNNILIPRNLEGRKEQQKRIDFQRIQEYIKSGSEERLNLYNTPLKIKMHLKNYSILIRM